jgi:hypothetical protein
MPSPQQLRSVVRGGARRLRTLTIIEVILTRHLA